VRLIAATDARVMVVTNQANLGRRLLTPATLDEIHRAMLTVLRVSDLALTDVLYCPHIPEERCACRKPRPGMITTAMARAAVTPEQTLVVGDHVSDLEAAASANCWSIHVRSGRGAPPLAGLPRYLGSAADLLAVARALAPA
jgi:D-glycero-D-manno-heptose 1,7-bisphosphate phosphatase